MRQSQMQQKELSLKLLSKILETWVS